MSVSTHVLDTSAGRPASGIPVHLQRLDGDRWVDVSRGTTDADGRAGALIPAGTPAPAGTFRLTFAVAAYFASRGQSAFYETIAVEFIVRDAAQHHHVPLLLSPFGYSTYRGS